MKNDNPLAGFKNLEDAKNGYAKFDNIICVSKQAEIAFKEKFGNTYPLVTRWNIMDVDRILRMAAVQKIDKSDFTIVAVGRLCEAKNYTMLLDAIALLRERGLQPSVWIIGGGSMEKMLLEYQENNHLDKVSFLGAKENPYPYFAAADLYVSASVYEGLSTTVIEAMILSKPVIATNCTGMEDILGNSEFGMLIPITAWDLAGAIEKMMLDETLRRHYIEQSKRRSKAFDPETTFQKIEELL